MLSYAQLGLDEGARLVAGGEVRRRTGPRGRLFVEPTVFADVRAEMRIFQEEVFGPFTSVTPFETEEEALAPRQRLPFGLGGRDPHARRRPGPSRGGEVKAGIVWINDHHRLDPASPWGGVGISGVGREFGTESFNDHFDVKSVMVMPDQPFDWYRDT